MQKTKQPTETAVTYEPLLCHVFYFKILDPNYFDWRCTKDWQIRILHCIWITWTGFKRQITKHPHANKAWMALNIFGIRLTFRVGLQHHTWVWLRNEELYSLRVRFINWRRYPPF